MSTFDGNRMVSASEVERWSYCPLSWKLERVDSVEEKGPLDRGRERHEEIGSEAGKLIKTQSNVKDFNSITWVYLAFSIILLLMGVSLVVLTSVGSINIFVWRAIVILLSILMIGASMAFYFYRNGKKGRRSPLDLRSVVKNIDDRNIKRSNTPILFYLYGIALLVNGIVLLRPFGIGYEIVASILAASLILLYILLMVSVTVYFKSHHEELRKGDVKLGIPLVLMLVISLSVLFIFLSDTIDPEGNFGWVFLILSLIWFLGAIVYDLSMRLKIVAKGEKSSRKDLPVAAMALLASFFTASTFLAKGDNLDEYYLASIVIAGVWLIGAIFFFWRGSHQRKTLKESKENLSLSENTEIISADDLDRKNGSKPLVSRKHFLVGAPDMVLEEEGKKIPVEIKTGRVPDQPHFSHQMQLGAYLILLDVNYKQETPYGYIDYSPSRDKQKRFRMDWDMVTKALVLSKVSEIRDADRTDEAHRNHQRPGKCRNCSRRQGCPERLDQV